MGRRGRCCIRGPRDCALRRAIGFSMLIFAFGILFGMLLDFRFLQWTVAIILAVLGIFFLLGADG